MNDNLPPDIRDYDSDPRSPFYEEPPTCDMCGVELDHYEDEDGVCSYCPNCDIDN